MKILKILFVLSLLFVISACNNGDRTNSDVDNNTEDQVSDNEKQNENTDEVKKEENKEGNTEGESDSKENPVKENDTEDNQDKNVEKPENIEIKTSEAIYVGQVDAHTIEAIVEGETINLQTTEIEVNFDEFPDGSEVTIQYYKNENDQYMLKSMKLAEAKVADKDTKNNENKSANVISAEATYVGQVDPHTIEVIVEGETINLQTTEIDVNLDEIEDGSQVTIVYYENENGQYMLKSIE